MLYQYFSNQLMTELETETWLVAQGVELNGMDYLTGLNDGKPGDLGGYRRYCAL